MSWVETAKVGDKVVCINNGNIHKRIYSPFRPSEALRIGEVYTVEAIFLTVFGEVAFELKEVKRHPDSLVQWRVERLGYNARRFRPLMTRKTDISVFTSMLNPARVSEDA